MEQQHVEGNFIVILCILGLFWILTKLNGKPLEDELEPYDRNEVMYQDRTIKKKQFGGSNLNKKRKRYRFLYYLSLLLVIKTKCEEW